MNYQKNSNSKKFNENNLLKGFRISTSFLRVLPDFFIIGTGFCAKTQLYNHLVQHPCIYRNPLNETGFFDINFDKGLYWYKANFPTIFYKKWFQIKHKENLLVGETLNIPNPLIPKRISKVISDPKTIAILRNPIDRTYARYLSTVRAGKEKHSFEEALLIHEKDFTNGYVTYLNNEKQKNLLGPQYNYLHRGIYVEFLERWTKFFPKGNMLFLKSEDLFDDPLKVANQSLKFLGLSPLNKTVYRSVNIEKNAPKMKPDARIKLREFFKPYNEKLYKFLDTNFDWN